MSLATDASLGLTEDPRPIGTATGICGPRGLVSAAVGSVLLLLLLLSGGSLLADPDSQWHVAVGRWIVAHSTVPTIDVFSYTYAGAPWIAKEWISQLLLFFAYEGAGWRGVVLLTAVVLAGSFAGLHAWLSARLRVTVATAMTLGAFLMCEPHMLARPHVLVVPIIVAWMIALAAALERGRAPAATAALLMVAWTNMHGSFPFGLVMAGALAGEGVCFAARGERLIALRRWALFLAVSAAATTLSPFGWRALAVPLMMFGNASTLRFVNEWQPLALDTEGALAVTMLVATMAALMLDLRGNVFRILAASLVAYLMIRHVRFASLFGLVAPILAARTVAARLPASPLDKLNAAWAKAGWGVIGAMVGTAIVLAVALRPEPKANVTPGAAYAAALAHSARGPVYNDYDFGGFLIAHDVKTFVDGRTDQLFLGDFLPKLTKAIDDEGDAPFAALVAEAGAQWALIRPKSRTSAHFDRMPGWVRVYEDATAAAYVRN